MTTGDRPKTRPRPLGGGRTFSTTSGTTAPQVADNDRADPAASPAPVAAESGTQPRARDRRRDRPRYDDLERKEARLRDDQVAELNRRARTLARAARRSRQTGEPGERITDNTLIRVAVDLLLARADQLHGTTEDELRRSVGLQ